MYGLILGWYKTGMSAGEIACLLNDTGYVFYDGHPFTTYRVLKIMQNFKRRAQRVRITPGISTDALYPMSRPG